MSLNFILKNEYDLFNRSQSPNVSDVLDYTRFGPETPINDDAREPSFVVPPKPWMVASKIAPKLEVGWGDAIEGVGRRRTI